MTFYKLYLINSYNKNIEPYIYKECWHYEKYKTPDLFKTNVIDKRGSYMACVQYRSNNENNNNNNNQTRYIHEVLPIMFGSEIDYKVRGFENFSEIHHLHGSFYISGNLKIFFSISPFDALSLHVRQVRKVKYVEWYLYVDGDGMELKYNGKDVQFKYRKKLYINNDNWISMLNKVNPYNFAFSKMEYLTMFDSLLNDDYDINDLKNRCIISAPMIIKKYLDFDLNKRKNRITTSCPNMAKTFDLGNIFKVLCKQGHYCKDGYKINKTQSYSATLHDGRSEKTMYFLPTVVKVSNEGTKNAYNMYPENAYQYFCPINTKEIKDSGDQFVMSDYALISEECDDGQVLKLVKIITQQQQQQQQQQLLLQEKRKVVLNSWLTPFQLHVSLDTLKYMKKYFPHITTQYTHQFFYIYTKGSVIIKYSQQHNCCFSPAEDYHFKLTWFEAGPLSAAAKLLNFNSLRKTLPAKNTVAVNQIKGSVAKITSEFCKNLTSSSLGNTCYVNINEEIQKRIYESCILSENNDTTIYQKGMEKIKKQLGDHNLAPLLEDTDKKKAIGYLLNMYKSSLNKNKYSSQYQCNLLKNTKNVDPWYCHLNAAFGNVGGRGVLDGVVLDRNTASIMPPIIYNVTITVNFTFKNNKEPLSSKFLIKRSCMRFKKQGGNLKNTVVQKIIHDEELLDLIKREEDTFIGFLVTQHSADLKNSRHCKITIRKIGNHYCYLINFLPKIDNMYKNLKVTCEIKRNKITIVIKGDHKAPIKEGVKIATENGQKNICSGLVDLSDCNPKCLDGSNQLREYWGITRDGKKVHAQIVFSDQSLLSRIASGQLYTMLTSDRLAIGPNGEIIAPIPIIIHSLNPFNFIKMSTVKLDTLTNCNGFDSQNLSTTSFTLRNSDNKNDKIFTRVKQLISMHSYDIKIDETLKQLPINNNNHCSSGANKTNPNDYASVSNFWHAS